MFYVLKPDLINANGNDVCFVCHTSLSLHFQPHALVTVQAELYTELLSSCRGVVLAFTYYVLVLELCTRRLSDSTLFICLPLRYRELTEDSNFSINTFIVIPLDRLNHSVMDFDVCT